MSSMHGLQIRPFGQPNATPYSPERDIAHCTPSLVAAAIHGLKKENWEPWIQPFLVYWSVTEEQLADAVARYAHALEIMHRDTVVTTPREALEKAQFFDSPKAAVAVVMAKIGQIMTGAFFSAIRSTTYFGDWSRRDIGELVEEAERVAHDLRRGLPTG